MKTLRSLKILLWLGLFILPLHGVEFDEHVADLKKRTPEEFTLVEEPPFVVLSDQPERELNQSVSTVRWAVKHLQKDFFKNAPAEPIDIWLFATKTSYKRYTWQLFRDEPTTPFGYYSPRHRALLMNISTGSGTLVHELVHPFMRTNFPACPTWFDEGLASLFEQSTERNDHIVGLVNWRLPKLKQAIRDKKVLPFQQLTALTKTEFYGEENNPNYSQFYGQSRYLCYYLQEHGLLIKFYHEFTANAVKDPTGFFTLQRILGLPDMADFQRIWEAYVLELEFK